jgi:arsenate reductase
MKKKTILFVCIHNSGRSQMAEAFFNKFANSNAIALSAGTQPGTRINPIVIQVMYEAGIDLICKRPRKLTSEIIEKAHRVITMGCSVEETCPASFVPAEDWQIEDPESKPIYKVRKIRDIIRMKVEKLIKEL